MLSLALFHGLLGSPAGPVRQALGPALLHLGIVGASAWTALALAQTAPQPNPASPGAPPSIMAPPRPAPGDDQSALLRQRLLMQSFEHADVNGDGRLTQAEAAALPGLAQRYGQVDRDKDGLISREEFRAAGGP